MKKSLITAGIFIILFLVFFFLGKSCDRIGSWHRIAEGTLLVPADSVARWDSLLKLPPQVHYDTIYRDTGSVHYVDRPVPVPVPDTDSTYSIHDSLDTEFFSVRHTIGLSVKEKADLPIINKWSYKYRGPTEIVKTITQYVPQPVPYEVQVPAFGFYGGAMIMGSAYSFAPLLSGSYLKNNWSYDFGAGYQYIFSQEKNGVIFSAGIKRKF